MDLVSFEGGHVGGLDGRVAMVTGSARGIGAATARRLAADGAKVAVVDLEEASCKETVDAIAGDGGTAIAVGCDVTRRDQVEATVARVVDELGWLDVLVNNAGVLRDNLLFKMTDDDWSLVIDTHLRGSFNCAREAQKCMVERRWGKIVNLSSTSALGNRGQTNYSTAKAGLQGMTKTLAIELGPFNVNVNAVAPGFIETAMTRATAARVGVDFEDFKQAATTQIPLRRTGRPEDVANVISFLCSEDASYVSGQVIYVAGGPRA
jgi:3-oxoacyl-[acyl-carrier protein] reductase